VAVCVASVALRLCHYVRKHDVRVYVILFQLLRMAAVVVKYFVQRKLKKGLIEL